MMMPPETNKTMAIIVTVMSLFCCCNPISAILGIVSLFVGNSATSLFGRGNTLAAEGKAKTARNLALWGFVFLLLLPIISIIGMMCIPEFENAFMEGFNEGMGKY